MSCELQEDYKKLKAGRKESKSKSGVKTKPCRSPKLAWPR